MHFAERYFGIKTGVFNCFPQVHRTVYFTDFSVVGAEVGKKRRVPVGPCQGKEVGVFQGIAEVVVIVGW